MNQIQGLSRAAQTLAALAQPDVAAIISRLPRRPGEGTTISALAVDTDMDVRALGKAVARGRDAGMIDLDGDRVRLIADGVTGVVADLVARTPLGAAGGSDAAVAEFAPYGLVHGVPTGPQSDALYRALAALIRVNPARHRRGGVVGA